MLSSLFRNNPGSLFDVYLLTDSLTDSSAKQLSGLCSEFGHRLILKTIDRSLLRGARVSDHVSLATYYRVLIPVLLPSTVNRVLFLDSDIIVRHDLASFYNQPLERFTHAGIASPFARDDMKRLGIPESDHYFNGGVLLLNLELWRAEAISERILDYIRLHGPALIWWDQDALNAVLHGRWRCWPPKWNATDGFFHKHPVTLLEVSESDYREAVEDPCIVHFSGSYKPWMPGFSHPFKGEYEKYERFFSRENSVWKGRFAVKSQVKKLVKKCLSRS